MRSPWILVSLAMAGSLFGPSAPSFAQIVFDPAVSVYAGYVSGSMDLADLDGDGDLDVAAANPNSVSILLNDGTGAFGSPIVHAAGFGVGAVRARNVDGDGDTDLVVRNGGGFTVLANGGAATFTVIASGSIPYSASGLAVGRINADPFPDIVLTAGGSDRLYVFFNNGSGTFAAAGDYGSNDVDVAAIGDADGDGDGDIVAGDWNGYVALFRNSGPGTFALPTGYNIGLGGIGPGSLAFSDLDGDGDLDLAGQAVPQSGFGNFSGAWRMLNPGNGAFGAAVGWPLGASIRYVHAADLNGDGLREILATDYSQDRLFILTNLANGNFGSTLAYAVGYHPVEAATGDLDGDGDVDVVTVNSGAFGLSILRNRTQQAGLPPYPGSSEDLLLATGVNGPPTSGLGTFIKNAPAGASLTIRLTSPGGTLTGLVPIIAGSLFLTGNPPASHPGFPEIHFNLAMSIVLLDGFNGPFGVVLLPPSGVTLNYVTPSGLAGQSILVQGAILTPTATNGLFAITDGYEVRFL